MQNTDHIFLTGFMGSGKTTAGGKLATLIKRRFIDLDAYLEKRENRTIPEIFQESGEAEFRELETKYLKEILSAKDALVISLGGGTVCFNDNLSLVKKNGILVYIELAVGVLADRIKKSKTVRPVLKNLTDEELIKNIQEILAEREGFYKQAHVTVNGLNLTPQHLQQKIIASSQQNIS